MFINRICHTIILIFFTVVFTHSLGWCYFDYLSSSEFEVELMKLNEKIISLRNDNIKLKARLRAQEKANNELLAIIKTSQQDIKNQIDATRNDINAKYAVIVKIINDRSSHVALSIIAFILFSSLLYLLLQRTITKRIEKLSTEVTLVKDGMNEGIMKFESKYISVLQEQFKYFGDKEIPIKEQEPDINHVLALRVGEEIHRMRKRLESIPADIKGLGAITNSLMRLEEEFNEQGYEIVDLIGKTWDEGMNVSARFVPSDNLKPGEQIITRVIKPQINYKNNLIKPAEIEVSTGG